MCNNTNLNRCVFKVVNSIATALKVVLAALARAIYHLDPEGLLLTRCPSLLSLS